MGLWLVAACFWLQTTWNISPFEDIWGEATVMVLNDWQATRDSARRSALESVMMQIWEKRVASWLLETVDAKVAGKLQKKFLSKGEQFLVGLSNIQENRTSGNQYVFRALFRMDTTAVLRDVKRQLMERPTRMLHVYLASSERWAAPEWTRLTQPGLLVVIRNETLPEHCPVDFCLAIRSVPYEDGFEVTAELRTTVRKVVPATQHRAKPKTVFQSTTETFSWVATRQSLVYPTLPPELVTRLHLAPIVPVRLQFSQSLPLYTWTQILFLIGRQEPEVVSVQTISVLSRRATAVLHVRSWGGPYDVLFKGLYLGPNVEVAVVKQTDFFEVEVHTPTLEPTLERLP